MPFSSKRHVLTRATSSVRAHVSRMSRKRSATVTETPVCREVSSVSAWLCAASRRSLSRSSCCEASAASSRRLTAALSSDKSLPALPSSTRACQLSARRISSARELTWLTRRDEPQPQDPGDEQRHAEHQPADEQHLFEERRRPGAVPRLLDQVERHKAPDEHDERDDDGDAGLQHAGELGTIPRVLARSDSSSPLRPRSTRQRNSWLSVLGSLSGEGLLAPATETSWSAMPASSRGSR